MNSKHDADEMAFRGFLWMAGIFLIFTIGFFINWGVEIERREGFFTRHSSPPACAPRR